MVWHGCVTVPSPMMGPTPWAPAALVVPVLHDMRGVWSAPSCFVLPFL